MTEPPPPGWYDDPEDPAMYRYWDGTAWTEHRSPSASPPEPDAAGRMSTGRIIVVVVVALVLGYLVLGLLSYWFA